jgi:hypothetical protein
MLSFRNMGLGISLPTIQMPMSASVQHSPSALARQGAGDHRQGAAGGGVRSPQVTDLRLRGAVIGGPGRAERLPVGRGAWDARHRPVHSAQMQFMATVPDMHGPEGATPSGRGPGWSVGTFVLWLGKSDGHKLAGDRARAG